MQFFNKYTKINATSVNILSIAISLFLVGCGGDNSNDVDVNKVKEHRIIELKSTNVQKKPQDDDAELSNSHSIVSKHQKICPKLLKKQIDTSIISRNNEFLHGNYCDYYIYPEAQQHLSVDTHDANVTVSLIMPVSQILDNTPYTISETRRHVIRVEYNGVQKLPDDFSYNITVNLENS